MRLAHGCDPVVERVPPGGINVLAFGPVGRLVVWPGFPYVFQLLTLCVLLSLAVLGWGQLTPKGVPDKLYAKANLVNLVVWGLFWPMIVWATVLLGRVWCTVCPLELVSNVFERIGRRLGVKQGSIPAWMRAGWLMVILYAVLQLLVAGLHLHRVPGYTSVFLWIMLATAAATGLLFKDRAYCRGFCPVAPLLKVYGRGGLIAARPGGPSACHSCAGKTCAATSHRAKLDARSCPTLLNPATLNNSEDCLLCVQCMKNCEPGNMQLLLRGPFAAADARTPLASWPVTLFVVFVSGFVCSEVASEWTAAKSVFLAPAVWATATFGTSALGGWVEGIWTIGIFPLLLWSAIGGLLLLFRGASGFGEALRRIALPLAVVIAAGQMAKGLAKFVSWAGFLPIAWSVPDGVSTSLAMAAKTIKQPAPLVSIQTVSVAGMALVAAALYCSFRELRLANATVRVIWRIPTIAMTLLFGFVILGWGFLQ
ncbi:MAG: 4Fe-4S binding protein [Acidobacteria bacterium]|nr:4Fe-4S binding protein [Acidobacteriota bacterium]